VPILEPIWPPLCYADSAIYRVKTWSHALPFSLFQTGKLSEDIGRGLIAHLKAPCHEAVVICESLLNIPEENLKAVMPWIGGKLQKDTIASTAIESAVAPESNVVHAREIIGVLVKRLSPERLMVFICNREFVNQSNFPCVCVMFKYFQKEMIGKGKVEITEYCKVFQDPELGLLDSELKNRIFQGFSDPENISLCLHELIKVTT
jgi:hypothetical protein